jgi:hypothetical protein
VATSTNFCAVGHLRWPRTKNARQLGERPNLTALEVRTCARRSYTIDARNDILGCFGRSDRRAQGNRSMLRSIQRIAQRGCRISGPYPLFILEKGHQRVGATLVPQQMAWRPGFSSAVGRSGDVREAGRFQDGLMPDRSRREANPTTHNHDGNGDA